LAKRDSARLSELIANFVLGEGEQFDLDGGVVERALSELVKHFPQNADRSQILLKVAAINQL